MFYSAEFLTTSAWKTASQRALRDRSKEVSEEPGYIEKTGSRNLKRWLLVKENQTSQVNKFSVLFHVREDASVWAHWSHSFDRHLSYLEPVSSFSPSWLPSGCTTGGGCWLGGGQPVCFDPEFPQGSPWTGCGVQRRGCRWLQHPLFADMAGNILSPQIDVILSISKIPQVVYNFLSTKFI